MNSLTDLLQSNIAVGVEIAIPFLAVLLIVGVVVGLLQAATQVNEPSISFLAKFLVLIAMLAMIGPWALDRTKESIQNNIKAISAYKPPPKNKP